MYKTLSLAEARQNFASTLKRAAGGESLVLLKRGKPFAALISADDAIRYFRFRADEFGALVERDPAQQRNGTEGVPAVSEPGYEVAEETPTPATATTDEPESESSDPTPEEASLPEDFKADLERYVRECRSVEHPVATVVSEVLRVCGQFGMTEATAERLVAGIYRKQV